MHPQSPTPPAPSASADGAGILEAMRKTPLSKTAYDRLTAEVEDLTTRGRVEIARLIEKARELGDLKENGDYHAAKDDQGKMEARIRQLEAMLNSAEIVEVADTRHVAAGSVVTIRYAGDDDIERYLVGSIEERRDDLGVLTPDSPLGKALVGHAPGDTVSYEAPGGTLEVEVVAIDST